jgi:adenosylcobinamide-phosphate synthase
MPALTPLIAFFAVVVERFTGYPSVLQRIVGHPVQWVGALIGLLDRRLNDPARARARRRLRGVATMSIVLAAVLVPTIAATMALRSLPYGWMLEALLAVPLLAQKSLARHVEDVAEGLEASLDAGRRAVAHIVGRDPNALDVSGVSRAAIESLAENASDGVVAPAFWLMLFGLPGIVAYKAINTADSMIGHKSDRYRLFGWCAARLDDLVNLPASRLCGVLFALAAGARRRASFATMARDARKHVSPNAGWPEAAMAGALGVRLGGPRSYGGQPVPLPWIGKGRTGLDQADIRRALDLYRRMLMIMTLGLAGITVATLLAKSGTPIP